MTKSLRKRSGQLDLAAFDERGELGLGNADSAANEAHAMMLQFSGLA
jgi:hypothetical protein